MDRPGETRQAARSPDGAVPGSSDQDKADAQQPSPVTRFDIHSLPSHTRFLHPLAPLTLFCPALLKTQKNLKNQKTQKHDKPHGARRAVPGTHTQQ